MKTCKGCIFYQPDFGFWCMNGWSGDGSEGKCVVEPKKVYRRRDDPACRHYENKYEPSQLQGNGEGK